MNKASSDQRERGGLGGETVEISDRIAGRSVFFETGVYESKPVMNVVAYR